MAPDTVKKAIVHDTVPIDEPPDSNLTYAEGFALGKIRGKEKEQNAWFWGGCGSGLFMGCVGVGWMRIATETSESPYPVYLPRGPLEYQKGYIAGFITAQQSKKRKYACIGGIIGMAIPFVIFGLVSLH